VKKYLALIGFDSEKSRYIQELIVYLIGDKYQFISISKATEILSTDNSARIALLVYIENDSISSRKFIWQIKVKFNNVPLIISSENRDVANLAWQISSIHFLPFPLSRRGIALMMKKTEFELTQNYSKIKFNIQGGFEIISPDEICYCAGDGNYTRIFLKSSRVIMLSKKIKEISEVLLPFPDLVRIGKSYIVNINNIQKLDNQCVTFMGLKEMNRIQFSPIYIKRIKEQLLWLLN